MLLVIFKRKRVLHYKFVKCFTLGAWISAPLLHFSQLFAWSVVTPRYLLSTFAKLLDNDKFGKSDSQTGYRPALATMRHRVEKGPDSQSVPHTVDERRSVYARQHCDHFLDTTFQCDLLLCSSGHNFVPTWRWEQNFVQRSSEIIVFSYLSCRQDIKHV